jgi:hypothetical protein
MPPMIPVIRPAAGGTPDAIAIPIHTQRQGNQENYNRRQKIRH